MTRPWNILYTVVILVLVGDMEELSSQSWSIQLKAIKDTGSVGEDLPHPFLLYTQGVFTGGEASSDVEKDCNTCSTRSKSVMVTNSGYEVPDWQPDCPRRPKANIPRIHGPAATGSQSQTEHGDSRSQHLCRKDGGRSSRCTAVVQTSSTPSVYARTDTEEANRQCVVDSKVPEGVLEYLHMRRLEDALAEQLAKVDRDIVDSDKPGRRRRLENYHERLATFNSRKNIIWPRATPSAEYLASLGFVYTGHEMLVECHACAAKIGYWDDGKDPLTKHFTKEPQCPFLQLNFRRQLAALSPQFSHIMGAEKYANNSLRLHSFAPWPLGHIVTSYQLASVGFYYPGEGTEACCFSCGVRYHQWKEGDVPLLIHRRLSPLCLFLQELISKSSPTPAATPFFSHTSASAHERSQTDLSRPDYANEQVRLKSFKYLPQWFPCSRSDCAHAGLYFVRKPDVMKCFSCDVIVRDWVVGDTPEEKHRQASPHCKFLREFFPTKLDREKSSSSDEGVDPLTLPEPQFTQRDLQALSMTHYKPASLVASQLHAFSLSDPRPSPPTSLPTMPSSSRPHSPLSYQRSTSADPHTPYGYHTSKSLQPRPPSSYTPFTPLVPPPRPREEYVGPTRRPYHPSPFATPLSPSSAQESRYQRYSSAKPSSGDVPPVALPPSYQSAHPAPQAPRPSSTEDSKLCVVCMDAALQMVLVPCGHVCVCENCSKQITFCPMCRQPVQQAIRVFLPY